MEPERCVKLLADMGIHAVTGRVATGDWFAVNCKRAEFTGIRSVLF